MAESWRAVLGWRVARSHVLCQGGVGVGGGCLACRVEAAWWCGGRWGLGLACRVEAGWWGVARRVEAAWRVGSSGVLCAVLGRRGGGLVVGMLRTVLGRRWWGVASHVGVACWSGDEWRRLTCSRGQQWPATFRSGVAGWQWWRVASHVGAACWGGDEWKWRACTRGGGKWPATSRRVGGGGVLQAMSGWRVGAGTCARGGDNGLQRPG
ncbi:hypothetical protein EDB85DRAFT_1886724 [Lactarius pseudohatsudake]|nr:hypothetical protein EDB85DRAFT_1886724 [Lactarius pseudohatsudake]